MRMNESSSATANMTPLLNVRAEFPCSFNIAEIAESVPLFDSESSGDSSARLRTGLSRISDDFSGN